MNIAETKRSRMQMIGVLILALAANLACGLPGQTQSKPTAEPTVAKAPVDVVETAEEINSQPVSAAPLPAPFYLSDLGYFDFDNGSGIAGLAIVDGQPEPAAPDILFYNDRIVPQEGASLVVRDGPAPGYQDCNRAVLSYADLPTEKLHIGSQVCFQTGEEQTGFITVLDLFLDSYGDSGDGIRLHPLGR